MLTPTEKFIFSESLSIPSPSLSAIPSLHPQSTPLTSQVPDSFLFLFLSMIIIAASLYLPEHIYFVATRAWFYWAGEEGQSPVAVVGGGSEGVLDKVKGVGEGWAGGL